MSSHRTGWSVRVEDVAEAMGKLIENLNASEVELTEEEFHSLETVLGRCKVYGHRGFTR